MNRSAKVGRPSLHHQDTLERLGSIKEEDGPGGEHASMNSSKGMTKGRASFSNGFETRTGTAMTENGNMTLDSTATFHKRTDSLVNESTMRRSGESWVGGDGSHLKKVSMISCFGNTEISLAYSMSGAESDGEEENGDLTNHEDTFSGRNDQKFVILSEDEDSQDEDSEEAQ
mmetsp:Transcript_46579/g.53710  ORF Transcript_46579/g.53710 Transcript_46579/m.53710 type:complete len:172 (+) Transcript_46579:1-516(+)